MLAANAPVVFAGEWLHKRIPFKVIRFIAAGLFALLGILAILRYING